MLRRCIASGSLALFVALALPTTANHPQGAHGDVLAFDHKTGNEWWVEVVLTGGAGGSVQGVQAMDAGGPWVTLTKRSWGAWAASFHIEPGHQVKFRATWTGGETLDSCWFDHPSGVERCGGPSPPFEAFFTGVRGNEWWVQANVGTNGPAITRVDVALGGGAWQPLARQSWSASAWAASYHITEGTTIQLRATASDGQADLSSCRRWIPPPGQDATIVPCGGGTPAFDATFRDARGNEWWVEVGVTANEPLAAVEARAGCDPAGWRPLALRSWGSWAASFHVEAGSTVDFRARSADGDVDVSGGYAWPHATPADPCGAAWPQAGSFVAYTLHGVDEGPGSPIRRTSDATMRITFDGREWSGTCTGSTLEEDSSQGTSRRFDWTAEVHEGPPSSSRSPTVGSTFPVHPFVPSGFGGCGHTEEVIQVKGQGLVDTHMRHADGRTVSLTAWIGEEPPDESGHHDTWVAWEKRLGLLVEWTHGGHAGSYTGSMTDTDAPVR